MELLLAVLLGAALAAPATLVAERARRDARDQALARAVAQQTYITELQNRLWSHDWTEFAQLQNDVLGHTQQTAAVLNSFGESRAEEAYGENERDVVDQLLRDSGIDLEGPTVG